MERQSPPSLRDLQLWLKDMILSRKTPEEYLGTRRIRLSPNLIQTHSQDAPEQRLSVYRAGYYARHEEALADIYGTVRRVLGEQGFFDSVWEYLWSNPPSTYNLNNVGGNYPQFLTSYEEAQPWAFLPDLASLEWALDRCFHAKTLTPLTPEALKQTFPNAEAIADAPFKFQETVFLIRSPHPIYQIWDATEVESDRAFQASFKGQGQQVLIYRVGTLPHVKPLNPAQFELLRELQAGQSLNQVCSKLGNTLSQANLRHISQWFSQWMQLGIFAAPTW